MFHHTFQHEASFHLFSHDLFQRDGVGRVAQKFALVYVDSYAHYAALDVFSGDIVLNKQASHFTVGMIDVIGPFY